MPQHRRDFVDGVEFPGGDRNHKVVGSVVGQRQTASVESAEGDDRREGESLVAVDQGMVAGDRVEQRRRLLSRSG